MPARNASTGDLEDLMRQAQESRAAGRPKDAAALLRHAVALQPDVALFQLTLSLALVEAGDSKGAAEAADRACRLAPRSAAALYARARANRRLRRYEEALADLDAALALKPRSADYHAERAGVLRNMGRHAEAERALKAGLVCAPKHAMLKKLAREMLV